MVNDLLPLISAQFSKYQNFRKVIIIKVDYIFLEIFLSIGKKGYFCTR